MKLSRTPPHTRSQTVRLTMALAVNLPSFQPTNYQKSPVLLLPFSTKPQVNTRSKLRAQASLTPPKTSISSWEEPNRPSRVQLRTRSSSKSTHLQVDSVPTPWTYTCLLESLMDTRSSSTGSISRPNFCPCLQMQAPRQVRLSQQWSKVSVSTTRSLCSTAPLTLTSVRALE